MHLASTTREMPSNELKHSEPSLLVDVGSDEIASFGVMDDLDNAIGSEVPTKMTGSFMAKSFAGSALGLYKSCDQCRAGKRKCDGFYPCRCTLHYSLELKQIPTLTRYVFNTVVLRSSLCNSLQLTYLMRFHTLLQSFQLVSICQCACYSAKSRCIRLDEQAICGYSPLKPRKPYRTRGRGTFGASWRVGAKGDSDPIVLHHGVYRTAKLKR